jgi:hypothetical protein
MPEGTGEKSLPDANGTVENDVLLALDKVKPEEVIKAGLVDSYVCRPIKALQCALLFEASIAQAVLEMNILPTLDFVIEDKFEKLRWVELLLAGVGNTVG